MRPGLALLILTALAAQPAERHDVKLDLKSYPQATPQEALTSVVKAIEDKRIDYLLAHLADPEFVDRRVAESGGRFDEVLQEARAKLQDDPGVVKQLRRFLKDGEWQTSGNSTSIRLKDIGDRSVYLRKIGDRWFMENRKKPEPVKGKEEH